MSMTTTTSPIPGAEALTLEVPGATLTYDVRRAEAASSRARVPPGTRVARRNRGASHRAGRNAQYAANTAAEKL